MSFNRHEQSLTFSLLHLEFAMHINAHNVCKSNEKCHFHGSTSVEHIDLQHITEINDQNSIIDIDT